MKQIMRMLAILAATWAAPAAAQDLNVDNSLSGDCNYANGCIKEDNAASSAYAPALSAGADTCLGSTSGGAQAMGFGISVGSNWTDENCENIRSAKALYDMGQKQAALYVMCIANGGRNAPALAAAGFDCSPVLQQAAAIEQEAEQIADAGAPPPRFGNNR